MKGRKHSVLSRVLESQYHVFDIGCKCHLANLCCKAGIKKTHMQLMRCRVIYIFISNIGKCHKNFLKKPNLNFQAVYSMLKITDVTTLEFLL